MGDTGAELHVEFTTSCINTTLLNHSVDLGAVAGILLITGRHSPRHSGFKSLIGQLFYF